MALTVTATPSGSGIQTGTVLAVLVLNNASYTQNGTAVTSATPTTPQLSITPGASGNWVVGAVVVNSSSSFTVDGNTTSLGTALIGSGATAPDPAVYRSASTTTTSPTTYGYSAPTVASGSVWISELEIIANGTLALDASTPVVASTTVATTLTSASFTPPAAAILVALVDANWTGAAGFTVAVTDSASAYNWTQKVNTATESITSIWVGIPKVLPVTAVPARAQYSPPGRLAPGSIGRPWTPPPPAPQPYNSLIPGTATATGTAQNPVVTVQPAPAAASATATAQNPSVTASGTASPSAASATATAQSPVANVIVIPGVATATATAKTPTAQSGTIATPAAASATATALNPALQISTTVTPGVAQATATAQSPVVTVSPHPSAASATSTAQAPGFHISNTVTPGVATATATATLAPFPTPLSHWGVVLTEPSPNAVLTGNTFGGTLTLPNYNGTLTPVGPSSQLTEPSYGATLALPGLGATLVLPGLGAMITGGTMQQASLTLSEFNDMIINIAVTNNGSPYNLTGQSLNLLLKSAAGTPDSSALVFSSTGGSPAIVITSPTGGLATATLPNVDLDSESFTFYRLDVVNGSSQQQTTAYGPIIWITL